MWNNRCNFVTIILKIILNAQVIKQNSQFIIYTYLNNNGQRID